MIGRLSSPLDRGFVFDLVPTPPNDAGEAACSLVDAIKDDKKKGSKGKSPAVDSSSLVIDKDWVAEHARQVNLIMLNSYFTEIFSIYTTHFSCCKLCFWDHNL